MRNSVQKMFIVILGVLFLTVGAPFLLEAQPTYEQIQQSIDCGLDWLVNQQNIDGSWGMLLPPPDPNFPLPIKEDESVAKTAFAVVKLEDYAYEKGYESPFDPSYAYSMNVIMGLNYIFQHADTYGTGIYFVSWKDPFGWGGHETYTTGVVMMAIAASRTPNRVINVGNPLVDGKTYKQVLQGCVDYFVWSQLDDGGWRYWYDDAVSDNSNTGYAALGLRYAEAELYGFECAIPQSVKDNLSAYIDYIQCPDNGGSGYSAPCEWVNLLKTGNLLFEMAFVGDGLSSLRAQKAINYIEKTWNDPTSDPGWRPNHYQAMYCLMKGFESMGIDTIMVGGPDPNIGVTEVNWYDEMATVILESQNDNCSWPMDNWGDELLSTVWALLVLEKIAPPPSNQPPDCSEAYVDQDCLWPPNHQMIPVSILGVTDPDGDPVTITVTAITSDEPTATAKGAGGAKHAPDADGVGTDTAVLRAERSGSGLEKGKSGAGPGNGRVYEITFTAVDDKGGECVGTVQVVVPHDHRRTINDPPNLSPDHLCDAIDDGQIYDATQIN